MTCIVGLVDKGKVYIGADSAGVCSDSYDIVYRKDVKVFKNEEFLIGFTSSFRMGQLLRYKFNPTQRHSDEDVMEYLVTTFVDDLRYCFSESGYGKKESGTETGGSFLLGYEGRLFCIEDDYQIGEVFCDYEAIGCGASYAKGALFASEGAPADVRVNTALTAASYFSAGVAPPFTVESI